MKKSIVVATSLSTAALLLVGCSQPTTSAQIAEKINKNLNVLGSTVRRMDTIDNDYIANQDLIMDTNEVRVNTPPQKYEVQYLAATPSPTFYPIANNPNRMAREPYAVKLSNTQKVLNECIDGECLEQKCDMYTSSDGGRCFTEEYKYNCGTCDTKEILKKLLEKKLIQSLDGGTECVNTEDGGYCVTRTSVSPEENTVTIHRMQYSPNSEEQNKKVQEQNVPGHLSGYVARVQKLYQMTGNVLNANNTLEDCRSSILECVEELKQLSNTLKDNPNVSMQQIQALNNYVYDIKTSISRIKNCNGQLSNEISNISSSNQYGVTKSIDVMNSNYMRILNHLDVRITYLRNALSTLDQIRYIILETMADKEENMQPNGQEIEENVVEENNDVNEIDKESGLPLTNEEEVVNDKNQAEESQTPSLDTNNEIVDDNNLANNATPVVDENNENNSNQDILEEDTMNPNTVEEDNNEQDNSSTQPVIEENNTTNAEESNQEVKNNESNNDTQMEENATNTNNEVVEEEQVNEGNDEDVDKENPNANKNWKLNKNIDTYKENPYHNLDLDTVIQERRKENTATNTDDNQQNNTVENVNNEETLNNNQEIVNNNVVNNQNLGNTNNGVVSGTNSLGYEIGQNHNDINTPNGTFENTIIGQNNLSNGVPGHGATGLGNDDNNKNINTYGYNTIVDMVNRGTVNNGINTL